ncbi:tRNA modification GTPase TrmE [Peptoanaerobacter stomatis]|jgi:tRNA modification GTPase trmE|uniref:tRNA modification GTPase MnmE n=1 Tax=Peptoanaerobacter stomatis TaxID=796937 RepID=U6Q137_9FIRM|nr:tRNA uridine-5-carboxymethylaminomethyl(34) synthesis GTPase MnmE [Peptoanaerobacter stomatis]EJZ44309.1 tRNA modification GTPase TrmE [Peptoanaerobacter stomatis]
MYTFDTIVAPATASGTASINIIRISGKDAVNIGEKIFTPKIAKNSLSQNPRKLIYGHIVHNEKIIDEVMACYMNAPHTFTCEDVVEINCHGGKKSVEEIISIILTSGARLAENGEFTKRAFLNGRIDLSQAESVIDIINAKSSKAFENAQKQLQGKLSKRIFDIDNTLKKSLAQITVAIDFPEEDVPEVTRQELTVDLDYCVENLQKLEKTYKDGKIISDGINIAIIGRPNVGKSSLLNELLEENRAIVTDIAGTTRDIIQESLSINGLCVNLVDTAGIRDTSDVVEKIGVERSISSIENADIILLMLDNSTEISNDDINLIEKLQQKQYIVLINKSDLDSKLNINHIPDFIDKNNIMNISAEKKEGIEQLKEKIYSMAITYEDENTNSVILTNSRHYALIQNTISSLKDAKTAILNDVELDIVETDYKDALQYLGEITGESVSESLLDTIFSQFCIGK